MSSTTDRRHERWANLRHSIIGALLAAPPRRGELRALSEKTYRHPVTGAPIARRERLGGPLSYYYRGAV